MVTFVIIGEPKADKTTVYGFCPSLIVRPHGSHVVSTSVTFECMIAGSTVEGGVRHEVSVPPAKSVRGSAARPRSAAHQ